MDLMSSPPRRMKRSSHTIYDSLVKVNINDSPSGRNPDFVIRQLAAQINNTETGQYCEVWE